MVEWDVCCTFKTNEMIPHEELMYASEEDWELYRQYIAGLPTREGKNGDTLDKYNTPIPYGSGPHILRHFRTVLETINPKRILEIGFNYGTSSAFWLNMTKARIVSCDVSDKDETVDAAKILKERFQERFDFYFRKDLPLISNFFDFIFIDGSHVEIDIVADIQLAKDLNIPHLLFDDWYPLYGETQQAVAKYPDLKLVKDLDNLRLYKWQH